MNNCPTTGRTDADRRVCAERAPKRLAGRVAERTGYRGGSQRGLALLDVLLGIMLSMVLATVSFGAVNQTRQGAYRDGASFDAQQASIGLGTYYADNMQYPVDAAAARTALLDYGVDLGKNVTMAAFARNTNDFQSCMVHKVGASVDGWAVYDSRNDRVIAQGKTNPPDFCTGASPVYGDFVTGTNVTPTPTPVPTPSGGFSAEAISDTFSGSGALGTTQTGGKTYTFFNSTASNWTRGGSYAASTTAGSSNPFAAFDTNSPNVSITQAVPGIGSSSYFRVVDASNWLRLRAGYAGYDSYAQNGKYHWEYRYTCPVRPGVTFGGQAAPGGGYIMNTYEQASNTSFNSSAALADNEPVFYGNGCQSNSASYIGGSAQYRDPSYSSTTNYYYTLFLDKAVNGTVTTVNSFASVSAPAYIRVIANADTISAYSGSSIANLALAFTSTVTNFNTATKHGIGLGTGPDSTGSRAGSFDLTTTAP